MALTLEGLVMIILAGVFTILGKILWNVIQDVRANTLAIARLEVRIQNRIDSGDWSDSHDHGGGRNGDGFLD